MPAAGDAAEALARCEEAGEIGRREGQAIRRYGYVPSLVWRLVKAYGVTGDLDAADTTAREGLEIFPGFTDLVFEQAMCAKRRGDLALSAELFERCLEWGDAPARYSATVGCGTYMALSALAEVQFARGDLQEAERLFTKCLGRYPNFLGVVLPAATTILRLGADAETAIARIEELVESMTPTVRFMLRTALYEAGHAEAAETEFRRVLDAQPSSEPARLALGEALLSQSRWREAVDASAAVESDANAPVAARTQMFAAIMTGDEALAAAAVERGAAAGVAAPA